MRRNDRVLVLAIAVSGTPPAFSQETEAEARVEATTGDLENFKKAFSVCLEAKD
jgi:hypothetical protein